MANVKISAFTDGVTADATDRIAAARSPFGAGDNRYLTPAYIRTYLGFGVDNVTNDVSIAAHGLVPKAPNDATKFLRGDATWAVPSATVTLDGVAAATASQAGIANANFNIVWNWQKTSNSQVAFTFGETAAAINGTSTSGVPNQVLLKLATLASSTMSPLSVYSRAAHVFSVSPTAAQLIFAAGSAGTPTLAPSSGLTAGIFGGNSFVGLSSGGVEVARASGNQWQVTGTGTQTNLALGLLELADTNTSGYDSVASLHFSAFTSSVFSGRRSRGSIGAPTVITTGDDLLVLKSFGYVGGTNAYVEAATIRFDSTGVIADTTTGVGGIIRFETRAVGGAMTEAIRIQGGTVPQLQAANGTAASPAYSFSAVTNAGMYTSGGPLNFSTAGALHLQLDNSQVLIKAGTSTAPGLTEFDVASNTGLFWPATNTLGVGNATDGEWARFLTRALQVSRGSADATAYAINANKSRGTVASPTVITTGDDLLTISGYGYVGGTNTYQEAARITFDSTGAISDSATGIGGIITFSHATVGAEPVTVAQMKSQHIIHSGTAPTITAGGGTSPSIVGTDESFCVTIGTGGVATSVEVTFGNAFTTNAPCVTCESDTDIIPFKVQPLTNKVTITATIAFTAGSKIYCTSRGWE